MPDLLADVAAEAGEQALRESLRRALRDLGNAKATRQELVTAVYQAARDAASSIIIPPVDRPAPDRRRASPEVAICLLADWQWGKVTPDYNSDVAAARIARYAEKVIRLIELQRSH